MPDAQPTPKAIILDGPNHTGPCRRTLASEDIIIGRTDLRHPNPHVHLDLNRDPRVSHRHARVWRSAATWYIEDLQSKNGTFLDGRPVPEPVEFWPGAPVQTGDTTWTIVPPDWLFVHAAGVVVSGPCAASVNYATWHCDLPWVGPLKAWNLQDRSSRALRLRLHLPEFSDPCFVNVPALDPRGHVRLPAPRLRLNGEALKMKSASERATLTVFVDGKQDPDASVQTTVLPSRSWSYAPADLITLAAFVWPDHAVVQQIVHQAHAALPDSSAAASLGALVQSGATDAEARACRALYDYLRDACDVQWRPPHDRTGYQIIRTPDEIVAASPSAQPIEATCVDLAVLLAACLENLRLWPVIVLTGPRFDLPQHAFAGCWTGSLPHGRPVIRDRRFLREQVERGRLLLVECTALARRPGAAGKRTFAEAVTSAAEQLATEPWLCAVDIGSLRPPYGSITPLDCPLDAPVRHAYHAAEEFARRKRRPYVETAFLLYGCLAAGGRVVTWLLNEAGLEATDLMSRIDHLTKSAAATSPPTTTRSCWHCRQEAQRYAAACASAMVQEQHLVWALLLRGPDSGKFRALCQGLGIDTAILSDVMARRYPPPDASLGWGDSIGTL